MYVYTSILKITGGTAYAEINKRVLIYKTSLVKRRFCNIYLNNYFFSQLMELGDHGRKANVPRSAVAELSSSNDTATTQHLNIVENLVKDQASRKNHAILIIVQVSEKDLLAISCLPKDM